MSVLSGRGGAAIAGETSEVWSDASKLPPLGTRGFDASGNEYVLVDFGSSQKATGFFKGEWVVFDQNFLATSLSKTSRGFVGIVMAGTTAAATLTTTNRYGWVQVYGICTFALGTTDLTSAAPVIVPVTSDLGYLELGTTSADTLVALYGVAVRSAPDSCASTALGTSALAAPCTVQLNYPFATANLALGSS